MEGWKKVLIDGDDGASFLAGVHNDLGCIGCHGGTGGENTKEVAHTGMELTPSTQCLSCHESTHGQYTDAIHFTQAGYYDLFEKRSGEKITDNPNYMAGFAAGCAGCHVSCGECHISSPTPVGGGLVSAHKVNRTPDSKLNCTACHGSRVGDEYYGNNDYAGADVHRVPNAMGCMDCHDGADLHGDGTRPTHRYDAPDLAKCTDCHDMALLSNDYHDMHGSDFSCQVCHSQSYKSCNNCHVGEGITGSSYETFKIGYSPLTDRSEKFAVLRHIPIAPDTYTGWGLTDLPNFDSEPTWKFATPHNIRRRTDRTPEGGSCGSTCHNSDDFFLRAADLEGTTDAEKRANANVIVPDGSPFTW